MMKLKRGSRASPASKKASKTATNTNTTSTTTTTTSRPSKTAAHVSIASLTLAPGVAGEVKGELVACVEALHWKFRQPPQQVQLRISWWGAPAGSDTVVPFHSTRGAGAAFPLTSGPRFLVRYLRDMGTLVVGVEECPSGRSIGTLAIDTSSVDVSRPLVASVPCLGANKQLLATADVSLRIRYSQLLSSFEMAEHLASADQGLPLYPLSSATAHNASSSRRQTAASDGGAAGGRSQQKQQQQRPSPAAAASAGATVVTGATVATTPSGSR